MRWLNRPYCLTNFTVKILSPLFTLQKNIPELKSATSIGNFGDCIVMIFLPEISETSISLMADFKLQINSPFSTGLGQTFKMFSGEFNDSIPV